MVHHNKSYITGRYLVVKLHRQGVPNPLIQRILVSKGFHIRMNAITKMIKSLEEDKESGYNQNPKPIPFEQMTPRAKRLYLEYTKEPEQRKVIHIGDKGIIIK